MKKGGKLHYKREKGLKNAKFWPLNSTKFLRPAHRKLICRGKKNESQKMGGMIRMHNICPCFNDSQRKCGGRGGAKMSSNIQISNF